MITFHSPFASQPLTERFIERVGNSFMKCAATNIQGFRSTNEDAHDISLSLHTTKFNPPIAYMGVFDGHSGPMASHFLKTELRVRLAQLKDPMNHEELYKCIMSCDADFLKKEKQIRQQGSTLCFILIQPSLSPFLTLFPTLLPPENTTNIQNSNTTPIIPYRMTIANVGDSRAIVLDAQGNLLFATIDHKPEMPLESKRIEHAGGFVLNNRVDQILSLSRAIGDASFKENSKLKPEEQKVIALPDLIDLPVYTGCSILLFCDGLVEQLTNEKIALYVKQQIKESKEKEKEMDPGMICSELINLALLSGSRDNISVLMMHLQDGTNYTTKIEQVTTNPLLLNIHKSTKKRSKSIKKTIK